VPSENVAEVIQEEVIEDPQVIEEQIEEAEVPQQQVFTAEEVIYAAKK
jgi:hypothetical protein